MEKKIYVLFKAKDSISFYICPLENLPLQECELFQFYVDQPVKDNHQKIFGESMRLEWINNELLQNNFFETYHDGTTFPFRGNGSLFCGLAQIANKLLYDLCLRVSLEKIALTRDITRTLFDQDLIEY